MRVVSFVFFFFFLSSLFTYLLIASGEQKRLLRINGVIAAANLLGNVAVIPFYSFYGSAWVTLGSQIALLALTAHAARGVPGKKFFYRETVGVFALAALSSLICWATLSRISEFGTFIQLLIA